MASRNVEIYRAGHEAFNQRDFEAMTTRYADSITWTDHAQGRTSGPRRSSRSDFRRLGWWPPRTSGSPTLATPTPARRCCARSPPWARTTGRSERSPPAAGSSRWRSARCGTSTPSGRVVGGDLYYDQVTLLMQLGLMPEPASA